MRVSFNERPAGTVHLQYVGDVAGKPVRDFKVGEWMGWNGGYADQIERIETRGTMAHVYFVGFDTPRRMKLDRLAAIASDKWAKWSKAA